MKVLVPVDGSENSVRAAEYVLKTARNHKKDEITLAAVPCAYESAYFAEAMYEADSANKECVSYFEGKLQQVKKLFDDAGVQVKAKLLTGGDPARAIADYVQAGGYEKVVMGSRGLGPIKGMVLGSVAYKVLNSVNVPVTVIK